MRVDGHYHEHNPFTHQTTVILPLDGPDNGADCCGMRGCTDMRHHIEYALKFER